MWNWTSNFDVDSGYFCFFPVISNENNQTSLGVTNLPQDGLHVKKTPNLPGIVTSEMSEIAGKHLPCQCTFSICSKR